MKISVQDRPQLFQASELDDFYEIPPYASDGLERAKKLIIDKKFPCSELVDEIRSYNHKIGNYSSDFEALGKSSCRCVITGQQSGLMGGPAYTVLKAISCLLLARKAGALPIFWLASEDHDVGEVNHTYHLDDLGNLLKYSVNLPSGHAIEKIPFRSSYQEVVKQCLPEYDFEAKTYSESMAHLMARLFKGTGLIFVEPHLLRSVAKPFFKKERDQASEIRNILLKTSRELQSRGGKLVVEIPETGNLFCISQEGKREKKIQECSLENFSTNVLARPVLQSYIFPTIAYVAGPGEMEYHRLLKDYYRFHGVAMPWIVPRISATVILPEIASILQKCGLEPWDKIPETGENDSMLLDEMLQRWKKISEEYFPEEKQKENIAKFLKGSKKKIFHKLSKASAGHSYHILRNYLHPRGKPQERVLNWWYFQKNSSEDIVEGLLENVSNLTGKHYYIFLDFH